MSIVSVSRFGRAAAARAVDVDPVLAAASGETPFGLQVGAAQLGQPTGSWSSGTGTSPSTGQWTIGIGAPQ